MIKEDDFSDKQRELYETMSDISENCYCAGWMMGLEYAIWGALQDGDRQYGMGEMDAEQLERCRALATELDGWVIWVDDDECQNLPAIEWGPRFVSMSDWLARVTAKVDCNMCANRGQIDGLSQETHCDHCKWQARWRTNHYVHNDQGKPRAEAGEARCSESA